MTLHELGLTCAGLGHADRILVFGWWLHAYGGKTTFMPADISSIYDTLHIQRPPGSLGPYFATHSKNGGPLLKNAHGYRLEGKTRVAMEQKYGQPATTLEVTALLAGLPAKLPDLAERTFLDEALTCYRNAAFRSAIVMTWNLASAHLCAYVLKDRLAEFNARWKGRYPGMHKGGDKTIVSYDDFAEHLKESEVLEIARDAGIILKNVYNVMEPCLKKRNAAAHPSSVVFNRMQADAYIDDLITNAVLKIG